MFLFKKVKAGALQYVLVVSVIIAILIFAFITLIHLHKKVQLKGVLYKKAIENAHYAFDVLTTEAYINNTQLTNQPNITNTTKNWGIYKIVTVTTSEKNEVFEKIGLIAGFKKHKKAIYLQENNKPLAIVGNTKLVGNSDLPKLGIKRGNIAGTSYNNNVLLYGNSTLSDTKLPEIKNLEDLKTYLSPNLLYNESTFFELEEGKHFKNTFKQAPLVFSSNYNINLKNISLTGNFIIQSNKSITVYTSSILEDVILIAPEIIVNSNVKGTFQAFAKNKIKVKSNCKLNFPSALVVISEKEINNNYNPEIIIENGAIVKGSLLLHNTSTRMNFNPQIHIDENAAVFGEVYCNQNTELLGNVYGSVYTSHFLTKKFGRVFINHLYNAEINVQKLPNQFCGLPLETKNLSVAKWLY